MSWERAEQHNCPDGLICYGHKVTTEYVTITDGYYKGTMSRVNKCTRCGNHCSTDTIAPHREFRVGQKHRNWGDEI